MASLTISSIVRFFCLCSPFFPVARVVAPTIYHHLSCGGGGGAAGGGSNGSLKIAGDVPGEIMWFLWDPWDYSLCIKILKSNPNVGSSRDLPTLAVNIINAGISNTSNTYTYMQSTLKRPKLRPSLVKALQGCRAAYEEALEDLEGALRYIKDDEDYDL